MIDKLRSKWRAAHISKNHLKINSYLRLNKKTFNIYNTKKAVPNLIIIGSQKCGTSSLHYYLNEHPDIYMSAPFKESGYFIFDQWAKDYWKQRGEHIASKMELKQNHMITDGYTNQKYFGDSSTHYTISDRVKKYNIVSIIKEESENAKIIYLIRNPFARLTSAYYHMMKYHQYSKTIDDFVLDDQGAVNTTRYFDQVKPFLDTFKSNVLILQFEDLIDDTQSVINKTYDFLDLEYYKHTEFKVFNKTSPADTSKFSLASYTKLFALFNKQMQLIEDHLHLELNWDLSQESWVK